MDIKKLLTYIQSPESFDEKSLEEIDAVLSKYPFFQTGHRIRLKNLQCLKSSEFETNLHRSTVHIHNRELLFDYLTSPYLIEDSEVFPQDNTSQIKQDESTEKEVITIDQESKRKNIADSLKENIALALEGEIEYSKDYVTGDVDLIIDMDDDYIQVEDTDILQIDETNEKGNGKESKMVNEKDTKTRDKIIDEFLSNRPRITPLEISDEEQKDISLSSIEEDEGYLTETLAQIYVKQGYYSKAIFIYEKLILKYPGKSIYFVNQIEEIKKLNSNQ